MRAADMFTGHADGSRKARASSRRADSRAAGYLSCAPGRRLRNAALAIAALALAAAAPLLAQPTVAPTQERVGSTRGENAGDYNIVHSIETGYRFRTVGGNDNYYRSQVNFGNGVRLLGANLLMNSREGHGKLFDELSITTQGLGNDPYEFVNARLQHNRYYRYDGIWRRNDYANPGLAGAAGGHFLDTRRDWQDHDFTLFPRFPFRLFLGYSRNNQNGPGLTSVQLFDARGDEFPLFGQIDRLQTEKRVGLGIDFRGFRFAVHRGWQRYEEEFPVSVGLFGEGANPTDATTLTSSSRTQPYRGSTPFWRGSLFKEKQTWFAVNARFSYAGSRRDFSLTESDAGTNRLGAALNRQILVAGNGTRPVSSGALTLSFFPHDRVTITNHTGFHQIGMDGNASYRELNNNFQTLNFYQFQSLGIRTIANATDASVRAANWATIFGGYHYSARRIQSTEGFANAASSSAASQAQDNHLHTGLVGVRLTPAKPFSLILDGEVSRADRPFYPVSDRHFHALSARAQYKTRTLTFSAGARTLYNTNSISLFTHSSKSRNYFADGSWTPQSWFSADASYSRMHLDTLTGIAYFANGALTPDRSVYLSNLHTATIQLRFAIKNRADLFLGYSRVQDTGDGRDAATIPSGDTPPGGTLGPFRAAQVFPLTYQSPYGRLSVRLTNKVRWNFGYQYYGYHEEFPSFCRLAPVTGLPPAGAQGERLSCPVSGNYRAHTGFSSVVWSF